LTSEPPGNTNPWTVWRVTAYVVLVAIAFLVSQGLGVVVLGVVETLRDPAFDLGEWQNRANGSVLVAATLGSTAICVPLVIALAGTDRWWFLRIRRTSAKSFFVWCGALLAFVAVSDLITVSLGRPIVPDVMVEGFSSAHPIWLLLALALCAPLFEELFFRGFLLSALEAVGAHRWVAVVTSAALWSMLHLQYDLYAVVSIFVGGLLLGAARLSTSSILPCFAMHSLMNVIAYVETAYRAGTATA